ncbi:SEP domain-containing protein, partial [Mycena albidolilacea]
DELAIRHITFWRDGFTFDDVALMRYDDSANIDVLKAIHAGQAPPSLLNVRPGQLVELQVTKRTDEDYVPPKIKPFSGTDNRLGAPVPAAVPPSSGSASSTSNSGAAADASNIAPRFEVDQ